MIDAGVQEARDKAKRAVREAAMLLVIAIAASAASTIAGPAAIAAALACGDRRHANDNQWQMDHAEVAINKQDRDCEGTVENRRDRRKAGLDNIQEFLDILRTMNPRV